MSRRTLFSARAHHRRVFSLADDWKGLAAPYAEYRRTLYAQLPFDREARPRRDIQPQTRRCWTSRTPSRRARVLRFGPRVWTCISHRQQHGNSLRLRNGLLRGRAEFTTPFTIPQFPFVQTLGQQSQDNVNAAFGTLEAARVYRSPAPNPKFGLRDRVLFWSGPQNNGSGYSQQWNFTIQRTFGKDWNFEGRLPRARRIHGSALPNSNINQLPSQYLSSRQALLTRVPNPYFGQIPGVFFTRPLRPLAQATPVAALPRVSQTWRYPRDNVGNSKYKRGHREARRSDSRTGSRSNRRLLRSSKLIDDRVQRIFRKRSLQARFPELERAAADAYNRHPRTRTSRAGGHSPRSSHLGGCTMCQNWWKIAGLAKLRDWCAVQGRRYVRWSTQSNEQQLELGVRCGKTSQPESADPKFSSRAARFREVLQHRSLRPGVPPIRHRQQFA